MILAEIFIQGAPAPSGPGLSGWDYLLWALLLLAAIVGGCAVLALRRRVMGRDITSPAGLTVEQLDQLRVDGVIDEQEHRRACRVLAGQGQAPVEKPPRGDEGRSPAEDQGSEA